MNILLVDIGNTRVKWARLKNGRLTKQHAASHEGWQADDFAETLLARARGIERVLVASVGGQRLDAYLTAAVRRTVAVAPEFIVSTRRLGGVITAYTEPWRLGVDRLVAVIGARRLVRGRAVCVVDVGTAMTIDLVDVKGRHVGGAITPGPRLMVASLLRSTSGIRRRARGGGRGRGLFARNTAAAVELGARYSAAAIIDRAVDEARGELGAAPRLVLTGGAASELQSLIRAPYLNVPDLVLRGLAALI